jgi:iron complex outermembrane recepter protein
VGRLGILLIILFFHAFAQAQLDFQTPTPVQPAIAPIPQKSKSATKEPEPQKQKILVTGSYIRRTVDADSPSPVTEIENSNAQEAASFSAGGMLNDSALTSTSTNSSGSTNVSFHGQSSANNLVLLNGLRLPKPGGGDSPDIDFIPASGIERVEILKDGASALYGSEALAGVVNIMTKREYDGANISIRHTHPEKGVGLEHNVVGTYGKNFKGGNFLGVFQFRRNEPYRYSSTEYGITDVKTGGSTASSPGNLMKGNTPYRAADCPADRIDSSGACRYDYYSAQALGQERQYYNLLLSTGINLGNNFRFEAATVATRQVTNLVNTPIIVQLEDQSAGGGRDLSVPGSKGNDWSNELLDKNGNHPTFNPTDKLNVNYSADEELGPRSSTGTLDAIMTQAKIGQETDNFDWNFSAGYGLSNYKEEVTAGNANKLTLHDKLLNGSWDPYKPMGSKDSLSDALVDTWNTNFSDILNARLIASGKLVDWGNRSVFAAVGLEGQLQTYRFRADSLSLQDIPLTGKFSNQDGRRDVSSVFVELTQNPIPRLQVQLAGRFDKYSDFGSTTNPKIGLAYKFNDVLSARSSFGTGFKAPDLRSLYQGNLTRPSRLNDGRFCALPKSDPLYVHCNNLYSTTSYGNNTLEPELANHFNIGLQFNPKNKWQFTVDHWRIQGRNALRNIDLSQLTSAEQKYGTQAVKDLGVTIVRDPTTQVIQSITYPLRTNSGGYRTAGLDFGMKYRNNVTIFGVSGFNFVYKMDHSHIFTNNNKPFSFQPEQQQLDLEWKNVMSFNLSRGKHLGSWRVRTFSMGEKDTRRAANSTGHGTTPTYSEHDLHYEYFAAWEGVITFGVRNIFGRKVYNDNINGRLFPASVTPLGRTYYVGYSQDF